MEHDNIKECNYKTFVEAFDLKEKFGNKNNSALHAAYLIKSAVDLGMNVNYSYHSFVHGEEGDSDAVLEENRKGSIHFSIYPHDLPENLNENSSDYKYLRIQLAYVSLKNTKVLDYINKMVLKKYPSDKEWEHEREFDSREIFADKLYGLKNEKYIDGKLVQRLHNRITVDNFDEFLHVFLTDKLLKEFHNITDPNFKKQETMSEQTSISKPKIK